MLRNWQASLLLLAALALAGGLFYLWSYNKGYEASEARHAAASLAAVEKSAAANADAVAKANADAVANAQAHAQVDIIVRTSHENDDDNPAPAVIQRTLVELRRIDGENSEHR